MAKSSDDLESGDIIELTDLIEAGDPAKAAGGDSDLDALLGGGDDSAVSLDDLLDASSAPSSDRNNFV